MPKRRSVGNATSTAAQAEKTPPKRMASGAGTQPACSIIQPALYAPSA